MDLNTSVADKSLEKDRIREKYRQQAYQEEQKIRQQTSKAVSGRSDVSSIAGCGAGCLGVIGFLAILSVFSIMLPWGIEVIMMILCFAVGRWLVSSRTDDKNVSENNNSERIIAQIYDDYGKKAQSEIDAYDAKVKQYCECVMRNEPGLKEMADHMIMMFQRMIKHASTESNQKFVDATLHYKVNSGAIEFYFDSQYTNRNDDYNFDVHRFRNLNSLEECEGLAQALARITMKNMKMIYPPDSMKIDVSHNDADVRLHYRGPNRNYVPPRPIA